MKVWQEKTTNLESELILSTEIKKYLTTEEIKSIFNTNEMVKNVDYIFSRSVGIE